jgi:hypothetical protein
MWMNLRQARVCHQTRRSRAIVLLALGILCLPALAQAQEKRLDTFTNINGLFYHRWSDDGGNSWSNWNGLPLNNARVVGPAAVVSDQTGRLWLAAKAADGNIVYSAYTSSDNTWRGWTRVPGSIAGNPGGVGVETGVFSSELYTFNRDSYPAISSWGPGRLELFMNTTRTSDGAIALLHTWADNGVWSGKWEALGTGLLQGSPAAVSWGPGRTDVFVRGGGNALVHKWFANGVWSRGWEDQGGYSTSDFAVTSSGPDRLLIFARGAEGNLWNTWFNHGWGGWGNLGGTLAPGTSLAATSRATDSVDVFVFGSDSASVFQKSYENAWWQEFRRVGVAQAPSLSAVAWVPTKRLEMFDTFGGLIYQRWSGDGGRTWSQYAHVAPTGGDFTQDLRFTGAPAVVSDRPGSLWLTGKAADGTLVYSVYNAANDTWRGWWRMPGDPETYGGAVNGTEGGVFIPKGWCCQVINYRWTHESNTALASWGPGRVELFINATRLTDNATVLLHTWADNGTWSSKWEVLGSGLLQGSPTAISWGPGRTDVFVSANNALAHKWFDNGAWSNDWEDLGPYITSSPSVASAGRGHLDVYARGGDGALWHRWFYGGWAVWEWLGGFIDPSSSPTAASSGPGNMNVFVLGGDTVLYETTYNYAWSPFTAVGNLSAHPTVVYWIR